MGFMSNMITVTIPYEIEVAAKKIAHEQGLSFSKYVTQALQRSITQDGKEVKG